MEQKLASLFVISVFIIGKSYAQNLQGNIKTTNLLPVKYAKISLDNGKYSTSSDSLGHFSIRNISKGIYDLSVEALNVQSINRKISITNNSNNISLILLSNSIDIEDVTVQDHRQGIINRASVNASKLPLNNLENPQVINIVEQNIIAQQVAMDNSTILSNIPGVVKGWSSTNPYFLSRGFNTRVYFRNGVASYSESELDPANMEQMEAVKGPTGTLFGSALTSFGGLFNRITKKPIDTTILNAGFFGGNMDYSRITVDANLPLLKDKSMLFRIHLAKNEIGSFQDQGFMHSMFIAPSILYQVNDRFKINVDAEIYQRKSTSLPQIAVSSDISNLEKYYDYKRAYSNNTIQLNNPYTSLYGQINYQMGKGWLSQTNITHSQGENTGNYLTFSLIGDSLLARNITQYPVTKDVVNQIQQNFIGDFYIGKFRNRLVLGLDFYNKNNTSASNRLSGSGGRPAFDTLNLAQNMPKYGAISPAAIDNKLVGYAATYSFNQQNIYSSYASDVFNVLENLSVLAGIRVDRFDYKGSYSPSAGITTGAYKQTSLSPKFGLVYELIANKLSFFTNYMNGFQNVSGYDVNNVAFKPQYANQWESGIKTSLLSNKLSATISYYDIRVENTLRTDPDNPTYSIQNGTQFSKGIEADIHLLPWNGYAIILGYAYNNSKMTNADADINSLRPVNAGPANLANGWMSYTINKRILSGLGCGFGFNYVGKNLLINSVSMGSHYVSAYTLFKGGLFYDKTHYRISLNMDNITNEKYYNIGYGIVTPGTLRRFIMGISLKF